MLALAIELFHKIENFNRDLQNSQLNRVIRFKKLKMYLTLYILQVAIKNFNKFGSKQMKMLKTDAKEPTCCGKIKFQNALIMILKKKTTSFRFTKKLQKNVL